MSRKYILMLLLIPCSIHAIAQDYYYGHYISWEKIPLTLNENKVCVSIFKENKDVSERILANVQVLDTIKDEDIFDIIVIRRSDVCVATFGFSVGKTDEHLAPWRPLCGKSGFEYPS